MPKRRASWPAASQGRNKIAKTTANAITQTALNTLMNALPPPARLAISAAQKASEYLSPIAQTFSHNFKGIPRRNMSTQTQSYGRSYKGFKGTSSGRFRGKFRKPRRRLTKAGDGRMEQYYGKRGYVIKRETHGGVIDPHCVYLGTSTYERDQLARAILGAMYRKLLAKAGISIPAANEILALQDPVSGINNNGAPFAGGFKIIMRFRRTDDTVGQLLYTIVDNCRFEDLVVSEPIYGSIRNAMDDQGSAEWESFESVGLYCDIGGTFPDRLMAQLNLKEEYVKMGVKVTMAIQNRTKGATAPTEDNDNDRVDNQPLKGWLYHFNTAVPSHRAQGIAQLARTTSTDGVQLVRSTQLPLQYREPPHPRFWSNCNKQSYVKLQPGDIRKSTIFYKYSGNFNHLVTHKLNSRFGGGFTRRAYGRAMLFSLEELLNSGSNNSIQVTYESERFTGCVLKTTKTPVMLAEFEETVQTNVP